MNLQPYFSAVNPPPRPRGPPCLPTLSNGEWTGRSALIPSLLKISPIRFESEVGGADGERRVGDEGGSELDSQEYV